ncbi:hypothetical protein TNCV_3656201 [Trichonephila clavipes]|nr:hypothetical protein TNCV_3656201 [Trichonephila clavipes]
MSQDIIQDLYASMPDRIASCIRARVGSTRKIGYHLSSVSGKYSAATIAKWSRYRIEAGIVTSSSPVPLKTLRVGQR